MARALSGLALVAASGLVLAGCAGSSTGSSRSIMIDPLPGVEASAAGTAAAPAPASSSPTDQEPAPATATPAPSASMPPPIPQTDQEALALLLPSSAVKRAFPRGTFTTSEPTVKKGPLSWESTSVMRPKECGILTAWGGRSKAKPDGAISWQIYQQDRGKDFDSAPWVYQQVVIYQDASAAKQAFDELVLAATSCRTWTETYENPKSLQDLLGKTGTYRNVIREPVVDEARGRLAVAWSDNGLYQTIALNGDRLTSIYLLSIGSGGAVSTTQRDRSDRLLEALTASAAGGAR